MLRNRVSTRENKVGGTVRASSHPQLAQVGSQLGQVTACRAEVGNRQRQFGCRPHSGRESYRVSCESSGASDEPFVTMFRVVVNHVLSG